LANYSIVIDANLAVFSVLNTPYSIQASKVLTHFYELNADFYAPMLWWIETTSVIHGYLFEGLIKESQAEEALELLLIDLEVQPVEGLFRSAFQWASRLRQKAAYDGFYLAAAEHLGAELWTADKSLVNNALQIDIPWVHWMGEI